MPEHFHVLMSEPRIGDPSKVIKAIKLGFSRRLLHPGEVPGCPISRAVCAREVGPLPDTATNRLWMRRFYDFNVWSERKEIEKLHYMHQNPVVRGLVERPEDWKWSSFHFYASGEVGPVKINDWSSWEWKIRAKAVAS